MIKVVSSIIRTILIDHLVSVLIRAFLDEIAYDDENEIQNSVVVEVEPKAGVGFGESKELLGILQDKVLL